MKIKLKPILSTSIIEMRNGIILNVFSFDYAEYSGADEFFRVLAKRHDRTLTNKEIDDFIDKENYNTPDGYDLSIVQSTYLPSEFDTTELDTILL